MKRILIVLIGLVFLLAACNGNTEANTNETTENNNEEEIEKESENINEETEEKNDSNEEEKDEVEPLYSINEEIWSLEPLKEETNSKVVLRSEEHTSELQSRGHLVCRLLLEKKNT